MSYSLDLREKVVQALESGMTQTEVQKVFRVSICSIKRWKKLKKETGQLRPRERSDESFDKMRGIPNHKLNEFKEFVFQNSELTSQEIGDNFGISDTSVDRYLEKLKITRKKRLLASKSVVKRKERNGKKKLKI